jgi:hypothetical protein
MDILMDDASTYAVSKQQSWSNVMFPCLLEIHCSVDVVEWSSL